MPVFYGRRPRQQAVHVIITVLWRKSEGINGIVFKLKGERIVQNNHRARDGRLFVVRIYLRGSDPVELDVLAPTSSMIA